MLLGVLPASPVHAEDWREKLREGSQTRASVQALAPADGPEVSYQALLRGGYTSNANKDLDPVPSAYFRSEQELVMRKALGEAQLGLQLRGSIDTPFQAYEIEFADIESAVSIAGKGAGGRALAATLSYRGKDDGGIVDHGLGLALETRKTAGRLTRFATVTADSYVYEPLDVGGAPFDLGDNDRLRLGLETGLERPLTSALTGTLSAGLVDIRYRRSHDLAGIERSSTSGFLRAGVAIGGEGPVTGEVGVMAFHRVYDEAAYAPETVLLGDASLAWRIGEKTQAGLQYLGDLDESVIYGVRGERSDVGVVSLTRALDEKLTATLAVYAEHVRYLGPDNTELTKGVALELTRSLLPGLSLALAGEVETTASSALEEDIGVWKLSGGFNYAFSK
ncbi:MAG: outer membrane beta-barrel protein [Hyphomicrobiales bacterium]